MRSCHRPPLMGSGNPGLVSHAPSCCLKPSVLAQHPHPSRALSPLHCTWPLKLRAGQSQASQSTDTMLSSPHPSAWHRLGAGSVCRRDKPVKFTVHCIHLNPPSESFLSSKVPSPFSHQQSYLLLFFLLEGGQTQGHLRSSPTWRHVRTTHMPPQVTVIGSMLGGGA